MSKPKYKKAFTLIELLVVIAIIGLLAGAVSVAFSEARKKSRDSKRIQEIKQLQTALQLHYDKYGRYPRSSSAGVECGGTWPSAPWCNSIQTKTNNSWIKDNGVYSLAEFMPSEPLDPSQGTGAPDSYDDAIFYVSSNWLHCQTGQGYNLVFALEQKGTDFEKKFDDITFKNCLTSELWVPGGADTNNGIVHIAVEEW